MKNIIFLSFLLFVFLVLTSKASAVSLIEPPVVNGVTNSLWQYQGSVKGVAWYQKGTYFSNTDGSMQFASSAEFGAYLNKPEIAPVAGTRLTSDIPMGPNGLNPGWQDQGNGWYFKNPNYSDAYGSIQFGSLSELNAYLAAEEAKKVSATITPTASCTGYENNSACRPEWADALSACIENTFTDSNSQCKAMINNSPTSIQACSNFYTTGACRPERVNPYATAGIAKKAEATAKVKGYTAVCSSTQIPFGAGIDPNTGLKYYYNVDCTINGKTGIGAEWITTGSSSWWQALGEYLTGKSSTISATSVPAKTTTTPAPATVISPAFGGTISGAEAVYVQNIINVVNQIIQKYRVILNDMNKTQ